MPEHINRTSGVTPSAWQSVVADLAQAVRFFSRLPVPRLPFEPDELHSAPAFPAMVRVVPLAGLIIGILPGFVLIVALALSLSPWLAATLSAAALTLTTGGLHEDGLADTADSLGGSSRERRLDIMRDSRIGSYGASALILGFALRIGALATLASQLDPVPLFATVILVASLSRTAALSPLALLPPARTDGAAHAVGRPSREVFWFAAALAGGLALAIGFATGLPAYGIAAMIGGAALSGWALTRFAARHLGGQTGDIAGATQQVAEIAALIGLLIALG